MLDEVIADANQRMDGAMEALQRELAAIRTGRASPALVDRLMVDYYGTPTPLNQLAGVSAPEARLLVIQPWDRGSMQAIERSIMESDLGLTPNNDGVVIRLTIPHLTEERRHELVRLVRAKVEDAKVAVRNVRRDSLETCKQLLNEKLISEDEERRAQATIQELTDKHVERAEELGKAKEAEILEI
ncbi:MAG TPA: ribosome recycling factor [Thermomicrobiales bacterium]|nr:ribosome recycling factor [Thermomicrobiales bacterium]